MNASQAEAIARMVHRSQNYGDRPYIDAHVVPVVQRVIAAGGDEDAVVVAWLHDVLEDGRGITLESQPMLVLSRAQALALVAITRGEREPYRAYIERVIANPIALLVKYCDLLVNLANDPPERLRNRYLDALEVVRELIEPQRLGPFASQVAAAEIEGALKHGALGLWTTLGDDSWDNKRLKRAQLVVAWCNGRDWPLSSAVTPERLAGAMRVMPYWAQGPANYFDMARALSAVLVQIHLGQEALSV